MPAIVTATQLRNVLGVSSSLYSDADLDNYIDSAEETILPLLTQYRSAVAAVEVKDSVVYFKTVCVTFFVPGQSVVVAGCKPSAYNGTYTVTDDRIAPYTFTAASVESDTTYELPQIPAGTATLSGSSAAELYVNVPAIENAILLISVEIFQSITAPGNQIMSDGFTPSPFVLGRSLTSRVIGLLSPYIDVETMAT
jgi:hypothetical protein